MRRAFIVVGEAAAPMAEVVNAARDGAPSAGRRGAAVYLWLRAAISRTQWVFSEERKDIRQHQFLMLLLVVDPRLDQRKGFFRHRLRHEPPQIFVNMSAIGAHLFNRGPRQEPSLRSRMPHAKALVIGVETIGKALIKNRVAAQKALQRHFFEKPCCVGQMPLGWACILVCLDDLIFRRKRLGNIERQASRCEKAGRELKLPILLGAAGGTVVERHECFALL